MCGHNYYDIAILIFEGLTALGTCGAVIFSLYVLFDSKKIKYIIKANSVGLFDKYETDIGVNIVLTNNSRDNIIKITSFPKIKLKKEYMIFKPNFQLYDEYKIPKTLSYGDSLNFFIDQDQIKLILKNPNKSFTFFFNDTLGHTYKVRIKRKLFEKQLIRKQKKDKK